MTGLPLHINLPQSILPRAGNSAAAAMMRCSPPLGQAAAVFLAATKNDQQVILRQSLTYITNAYIYCITVGLHLDTRVAMLLALVLVYLGPA